MHGPNSVAVHSSSSSSTVSPHSGNKLEVIPRHDEGGDSDKENSGIGNRMTPEDRKLNGCGRKLSQLDGDNSLSLFESGCVDCLERFEKVIRRVDPSLGFLDPKTRECENRKKSNITSTQSTQKKKLRDLAPLQISISVVDPDNNNQNMCLCSAGPEEDDQVDNKMASESEVRICTRCQNIINQQPMEHRKALISQRLTLANDIIVNRIDTQFLNASGNGNMGRKGNYEPYTPDSMESHSPMMLGLKSSSSDSSFTTSTTTTTTEATTDSKSPSGSYNSNRGVEEVREQQKGENSETRKFEVQEDFDLIERDDGKEVRRSSFRENGRPELQTMSSVEMAGEVGSGNDRETAGNDGFKALVSPGVNANQLKSRLEKLQILSRLPGHGNRKAGEGFGGRMEFEEQMRRREEKKELKEMKKAAAGAKRGKVLCCYQDSKTDEAGFKEKKGSQCVVM